MSPHRPFTAFAILILAASVVSGGSLSTGLEARHQRALQLLLRSQRPQHPSALTAATWAFTYGGTKSDDAFMLDHTADGGLVLAGQTESYGAGGTDLWLFKVDSAGVPLWSETYGTASDDWGTIEPLAAGGFVMSGFQTGIGVQNQNWAARLDESGNNLWQKKVGGLGAGYHGLVEVSGGFLVYGTSTIIQIPSYSFVFKLLKLDGNGNVLWNKELTTADMRTGIPYELADGSIVVNGSSTSVTAGTSDAWLMKLSSTGAILWQYTYGGSGSDSGFALATPDGGFLLIGATKSWGLNTAEDDPATDAWLVKLSATGTIQWQKAYGTAGAEYATAFPANDGGYLLSGSTSSATTAKTDAFLAKLDSNGTIQWQKTLGGSADDVAFAFPDSSGGYFLVGETESFGNTSGDTWIVKVDNAGAVQWQRAYGGAGDADGVSPVRMSDGTIVLTGSTNSYGAGSDDVVLAKLDSTGKLAGSCPFIHDTTATSGP